MSIEEKDREYAKIFRELSDGDSQCEYLFSLGMVPPDPELQRPEYRLPGCKTAIWLKVWREGERVRFWTGSDSMLVNGVLAIYRDLYEGKTAAEIGHSPPAFLKEISDEVIYRDVKRGGLLKWYERLAKAPDSNETRNEECLQ